MENMFTAEILVNERVIPYHVSLENDLVIFTSDAESAPLKEFRFRRDHEKWHELQPLDAGLKEQAIREIERYLLAQH